MNPKNAFPFDLSRNADLGPNGAHEICAMAEAAGKFIAADPAKPFFLMMQGLLHDWQTETGDPFLEPAVLTKKHSEINLPIPAETTKKDAE